MKAKIIEKKIKKWSVFLAEAAICKAKVYPVGSQFVYDEGSLPSGMTGISAGDILNLQRENGMSSYDVPGSAEDWVRIDGNPGDGSGLDLTVEQTLTAAQKHELAANINDRAAKIDIETSAVVALGYKVLDPRKSFAEQVESTQTVDNSNIIFEIKDEFDLGGESVTIPANCTLKFNGGKLKNGSVVCNSTNLTGNICFDLVTLSGTIINEELKASYFGITSSNNTDALAYNDAAFGCLVASCENCSHKTSITNTSFTKIINIDKDIKITEPVVIERSNLNCAGVIYYRGSQDLNGAVITIKGSYGEHIVRLYNNGIAYYEGSYESRKDLPLRGVTVTNFRQGHITFVEVNNFTSNVVFESSIDSDYVAYNTFDFWNIRNGMYALTINVINTGWINNNTFNRGTFNVLSESVFLKHNIAFLLKGNSSHGANQLHFNDNNIEQSHLGIYLDTLALEDCSINRLRNEGVSNSNLIVENNVSTIAQYYKTKVTLYRDNIGQENLYYRRFELVLNSALETKKTYSWELSSLKKGNTFYFKQPITYYATPSNVYNFREVYSLTPTTAGKITEEGDKFLKFSTLYSAPIFVFNHNGKFVAKFTSLLGSTSCSVVFVLVNKTLNSNGYRTITTSNGFINPNAPLFSESVSYSKWDQVRYEGKCYRFTSDKTAGDWDASKVVELTAKSDSADYYYMDYVGKGVSSVVYSQPLVLNGNGVFNINLSRLPTNYYLGAIVGGSLSKLTIDVKSDCTLVSENEQSIISCAGVPDSMIGYFPKTVDGTLVRGYSYWDTTSKRPIYWNGTAWVDALGEPVGLQVSDTTVFLDADGVTSKTINVYSSSAITATAQNPDGSTTDLWLTASVGTLTSGAYPITLAANSANTTNPRGAKVIISNGTDVVIVNVVQNYSTT